MAGSSAQPSLPKFASAEQLAEFFDTHDFGDYEESLPEVEFQVDLKSRRHFVDLDGDLLRQVQQIAQKRHVTPTSLIESWIREKAEQATA
jgi:hypothetical protein